MKHKKKKNHTYLADIVQKVVSPNNRKKLTTKQKKSIHTRDFKIRDAIPLRHWKTGGTL